jgi:large subunit ribosomal protein L18
MSQLTTRQRRERRHKRVRKHVFGTAERPRLVVFRSNRGIAAQIVDDTAAKTLAAASWLDARDATGTKSDQASAVGKMLAEKAKAAGIENVLFDRGGYLYHGRVKALAEAAREGGLKF